MMKEHVWIANETSFIRLSVKDSQGLYEHKGKKIEVVKKNNKWKSVWNGMKKEAWTQGDVLLQKDKKVQTCLRIDYFTWPIVVVVVMCLLHHISFSIPQTHAEKTSIAQVLVQEELYADDMNTEVLERPTQVDSELEEINLDDIQIKEPENKGVEVVFVEDVKVDQYERVGPAPKKVSVPAKTKTSKPQKVNSLKKSQRYKKAKKLFIHGKIDQAKSLLEGKGSLRKQENQLLAEIYVLECKQWVTKDEIQKALVTCEKAFTMTKHEKAKKFLAESEKHAKDLYYQGYAVEGLDPEKAKKLYMESVLYAPISSSWKNKSLNRVKKLSE